MSEVESTYKGPQIELDLQLMRYKRDADEQWMKLPQPKMIVLTQRRMKQYGGLRGSTFTHRYNAFCVYIRAGKLNILAHQGRRDRVVEEAQKLARFLDLPVKDIIPRDQEGKVIDDDVDNQVLDFPLIVVVFVLVIFLIIGISSLVK